MYASVASSTYGGSSTVAERVPLQKTLDYFHSEEWASVDDPNGNLYVLRPLGGRFLGGCSSADEWIPSERTDLR
jgi:hypothetical protein